MAFIYIYMYLPFVFLSRFFSSGESSFFLFTKFFFFLWLIMTDWEFENMYTLPPSGLRRTYGVSARGPGIND